jgi:histidinol-phosphate aminotransferase
MKQVKISDKLARKELLEMQPYQSARRLQKAAEQKAAEQQTAEQQIEQPTTEQKTLQKQKKQPIWLNANEASGPGNYQINSDLINRYPDFQPEPLLLAYSEYCALPVSKLLATRGADEGIELVIRSFCRAYQDSILICPPTYGMYAISAENHGAGIVRVPLVDNALDLEGLAQQVGKVKVVFLCSPGNPTGNLLALSQIKSALALFKDTAIVVLDQAYIEYCPAHDLAPLLNDLDQYDNLVILRTLSKAFALAGLRCGFTLASPDIIKLLSKVIAPYPVPGPVAELASIALNSQGIDKMQARVAQTTTLRDQLSQWLQQQTWCEHVFASDANFVLFKTNKKQQIIERLNQHGILIRDQSTQQQLSDCLRISIGSEQELALLQQILS